MNPTDAGPPVIAACDPTGPGEMLMGSGAVNVVWTPKPRYYQCQYLNTNCISGQ